MEQSLIRVLSMEKREPRPRATRFDEARQW
jgi:hypothetical protein